MTRLSPVLLGSLAIAGSVHVALGAVIYTEEFPNSSGANAAHNSVGWSAYLGSTATNHTSTSTSLLISYYLGKSGVAGCGAKTAAGNALVFTNEVTRTAAQMAALQSMTISFYSNNTVASSDAYRIALRLDPSNTPADVTDDVWVASNATFYRNSATAGSGTAPGNFVANGELESFAFTTAAASWRDLTFTPGSALSVAASARGTDLPAGGISAFGLYLNGTSTMRYDAYTVDYVVPEPASLLSAGAVALVLPLGRRRRV